MDLTVAYRGRSAIAPTHAGLALTLAPDLRRDRVSYDGTLRDPVPFREAISALHEVAVGDLRHRPRDRTAYRAHRAEVDRREAALRAGAIKGMQAALESAASELPEPIPPDLERRYRALRSTYWRARDGYLGHLLRHDPALWRALMPYDPVITVAPDCLFFECFSADESSYACLTVERSAFAAERDVSLGTTNVDYSEALFEHFQSLRSYRETRFRVDPSGFEVAVGGGSYREEKIDLPASWLRGFLRFQSAIGLPMRRVSVGREGLYAILAFLKRHRAARSPRAIRFELEPGRPARAVLEPWEHPVGLGGAPYGGPRPETIRAWGRDRLRVLARTLPLAEAADVYLLGTGLPSVWSVLMGPIRLALGLSGWTANDWTGSSAIEQLAPPVEPERLQVEAVASAFKETPSRTLAEVARAAWVGPGEAAAALVRLAGLGLVIHDLPAGVYRWRQVMPVTLSAELLGPEPPETLAGRRLVSEGRVRLTRDERRPDGLRLLEGQADRPVSLVLDADGRMLRGRCTCSHHFTGGLRKGPCRHLLALRAVADAAGRSVRGGATLASWFANLLG